MNYEEVKETVLWFFIDVFIILYVVLTNSCCSVVWAPPPTGLVVKGGSQSEVAEVVSAFAERVPGFNPEADLEVTFVPKNGEYSGRTYDRHTVVITSLAVLPHELFHVHYWRRDGDPDRNHEQPGGPWTEEDNETARSIRVALGI